MGRICVGLMALFLVFASFDARAQTFYWTAPGFNEGYIRSVQTPPPPLLPDELFDVADDEESYPGGVAIDVAAGVVYWANNSTNEIYRGAADGSGTPTLLFDAGDGVSSPTDIAIDPSGLKIYWIESPSTIKSGNLDGSGSPTTLFDATDSIAPSEIALDLVSSRIFWIDSQSGIKSGNLDGSGSPVEVYAASVDRAYALALDASTNKLCWVNFSLSGTVHAVYVSRFKMGDLDGVTPATEFYSTGYRISDFQLDVPHGHFYWNADRRMIRTNLDGLGTVILYDDDNRVPSTAYSVVDSTEGYLYWRDATGFEILKAPLVGDPLVEDVDFVTLFDPADGVLEPRKVAIDVPAAKLYWTDKDTHAILSGNIDGSGTPKVLFNAADGVDSPEGIELDTEGGKIYWADRMKETVNVGNLDGSGSPVVLYSSIQLAYDIAIDKAANKIYWSTESRFISVGNLDGTGNVALVYDRLDGLNNVSGLEIDVETNTLYWITDSKVQRGSATGVGAPVTLFENGNRGPLVIDTINGKIYWSAGDIIQANLDGSGQPGPIPNVENMRSPAGFTVALALRDTIYVDFANAGLEKGTQALPYDTIKEGVAYVAEDGEVILEAGESSATLRITKGMTLTANNGTVRIGDQGARAIGKNRVGFIAEMAPKN